MTHSRPERDLQGRVAIVTGAGSLGDGIGNGRAAAILLAEDGCSVVCVDLNLDLAQKTAQLIRDEVQGSAIAFAADVTKEEECQNVVRACIKQYGRLDILVNNVGINGPMGTTTEVDIAAFYKGLEVNVGSMILMAKYAIPQMCKNPGQWAGSIVNLGSTASLKGGHPAIFYPTSKGAIPNLTRAMVRFVTGPCFD
jgi:NAD(P)-dependent dehydrogenase (short-subunit alcohol dehydrogenase family)